MKSKFNGGDQDVWKCRITRERREDVGVLLTLMSKEWKRLQGSRFSIKVASRPALSALAFRGNISSETEDSQPYSFTCAHSYCWAYTFHYYHSSSPFTVCPLPIPLASPIALPSILPSESLVKARFLHCSGGNFSRNLCSRSATLILSASLRPWTNRPPNSFNLDIGAPTIRRSLLPHHRFRTGQRPTTI